VRIKYAIHGCVIFIAIFSLSGCGGDSLAKEKSASLLSVHEKQQYLDEVNKYRIEGRYCGSKYFEAADKLTWNDSLYKAAYEHSQDMAGHSFVEHDGSGTASDWTAQDLGLSRGSRFDERIADNGFADRHNRGENVAAGQTTVKAVVKAWIDSPEHCENIMSPNYNSFGMSLVKNHKSRYEFYWTQDFGSKQH
jgi:uncharacterized protein YkwD